VVTVAEFLQMDKLRKEELKAEEKAYKRAIKR
jgi:hypothetical protein